MVLDWRDWNASKLTADCLMDQPNIMLSCMRRRIGPLRPMRADHRIVTSAPLPKFVMHPQHLLRRTSEAKGHSPIYGAGALFDLKFLDEFAAGGAGTSNRRHQG